MHIVYCNDLSLSETFRDEDISLLSQGYDISILPLYEGLLIPSKK